MVGTVVAGQLHGMGRSEEGPHPYLLLVHVLGSMAGASATGLLLSALGDGLLGRNASYLAVIGAIGVVYSLRDAQVVRVPALQSHRQVPHRWRLVMPAGMASLLYGIGLGVGVVTPISVGAFYSLVAWTALRSTAWTGVLCMALFGLGRALPLYIVRKAGRATPSSYAEIAARLSKYRVVILLMNGLVMALLGGLFLGVGVRALTAAGFGPVR